jgi:uncharacterized protein (TIGR00106 family)
MAVAIVSVVPAGTPDASISSYVARCIDIVEESGLKYELNPMGTVIEGDPEAIVRVVLAMHESAFDGKIVRVLTSMTIDDRRDKPLTMRGKIEAVERKRSGS